MMTKLLIILYLVGAVWYVGWDYQLWQRAFPSTADDRRMEQGRQSMFGAVLWPLFVVGNIVVMSDELRWGWSLPFTRTTD